MMPGNHVATPDGRHVWESPRRGRPISGAGESRCCAGYSRREDDRIRAARGARRGRTAGDDADPSSRWCDLQVHARIDESFTLVYDAVVTRGGTAVSLPTAVATGAVVAEQVPTATPVVDDDAEILSDNLTAGAGLAASFAKWSPDSGEAVRDRLGAIVGGAMGYEPEDLPWEVPLIELGLDSLMAVRIKNRVEYDFDLPPIQLTAVRDANLSRWRSSSSTRSSTATRSAAARTPADADARGDCGRTGCGAGRGDTDHGVGDGE